MLLSFADHCLLKEPSEMVLTGPPVSRRHETFISCGLISSVLHSSTALSKTTSPPRDHVKQADVSLRIVWLMTTFLVFLPFRRNRNNISEENFALCTFSGNLPNPSTFKTGRLTSCVVQVKDIPTAVDNTVNDFPNSTNCSPWWATVQPVGPHLKLKRDDCLGSESLNQIVSQTFSRMWSVILHFSQETLFSHI